MNNSGKFILSGNIYIISPLIIASGYSDKSDVEILKDKSGIPFIPATSFLGVLRHFINPDKNKSELKLFLGFSEDNKGKQSSIICRDLNLINAHSIVVRDGIKINNKTGITADKSKYDYEVLEPGAIFSLYIECFFDNNNEDFIETMLNTIYYELTEGNIFIGAKTNNGFGRIKLQNGKISKLEFNNKNDILKHLKNELCDKNYYNVNKKFSLSSKVFEIDAHFVLKTSLIVRSYSSNPEMPDAVNITSNNKPVLPGTSIKGAVRARAEKIANTILDENISKNLINELFGFVDTDKSDEEAIKGRISVEESILPDYPQEIQHRIKIDRFTGGTIGGALFDTMPLFGNNDETDTRKINLKFRIKDFKPAEAGLLLLLLKDLWTGDLVIGGEKNVGRGVLTGQKAEVRYDGKMIVIEKDISKLKQEEKQTLQNFVCEFNNFGGKNG